MFVTSCYWRAEFLKSSSTTSSARMKPSRSTRLSCTLAPRDTIAAAPLSLKIRGFAPMTAPTYEKLTPPKQGTRITVRPDGTWQVPDDPIVCLLRGDGIGLDV